MAKTDLAANFDWDKAIALFFGRDPLQKCRKGLHLLTPDNIYVSNTTGHRRCRECTQIARKTRAERKKIS